MNRSKTLIGTDAKISKGTYGFSVLFGVYVFIYLIAVMGKSQIKSQVQITNQFYRYVKFLKMFSLHNNYRISQKSQPFCVRQ